MGTYHIQSNVCDHAHGYHVLYNCHKIDPNGSMQSLPYYWLYSVCVYFPHIGDGLYNFIKIMVINGTNLYSQRKEKRTRNGLPMVNNDGNNEAPMDTTTPYDE